MTKPPCIVPRYIIGDKIGTGAYGAVFSATDTVRNKLVAIKRIDKFPEDDDLLLLRMLREILTMEHMKHPNIIECHDVLIKGESAEFGVWIVMPLMPSDLHKVLGLKPNNLDHQHIKFITYQLLLATEYMHNSGIMHRDIKPQNILINTDCIVRLCDMGLARGFSLNKPSVPLNNPVQTRWYRAPEALMMNSVLTSKIDIWSIGCILAEMFLGRVLFRGASDLTQVDMILNTCGVPGTLSSFVSTKAVDYITKCKFSTQSTLGCVLCILPPMALDLVLMLLRLDPYERISASEALLHPYFDDFRDSEDTLDTRPFDLSHEKKCISRETVKQEIRNAVSRINAQTLDSSQKEAFSTTETNQNK